MGHSAIWESQTPLCCVRDLYDSYAANPLGTFQDTLPLKECGRKGGNLLERLDATQLAPKHTSFLERYLDRQADIEKLLQKRKREPLQAGKVPALSRSPSTWSRPEEPSLTSLSLSMQSTPQGGHQSSKEGGGKDEDTLHLSVPLCSRTQNTELSADRVLTVKDWSGGVVFSPPDPSSFRLTIKILDDVSTKPLFIGIVPEDADLATVNYFNGNGGVLLSLGGTRLEDELTDIGAPGGPSFHIFGRRTLAVLPTPLPGGTLAVHYWEEESPASGERQGRMRLIVNRTFADPLRKTRLPRGRWRPCVLLCVPGTRVQVEQLI